MKRKIKNDHVMCTTEHGKPIYISDPTGNLELNITENKEEATIWDAEYDNTKLQYIKAITGYKELMFIKK